MKPRQRLLVKEKELTRARDALAAQRRMTWLAVGEEYAFDGPAGRVSLLDLFDTASNGAVNLASRSRISNRGKRRPVSPRPVAGLRASR